MSPSTPGSSEAIDPIRLAVIQKQVDHISHQMGWIMTRTARSPIFSQSHDFTCFVATARGEIIAQADGIPIHSGGGGFVCGHLNAPHPSHTKTEPNVSGSLGCTQLP